jgi:tetratricopeptide (TPR) repeat protein
VVFSAHETEPSQSLPENSPNPAPTPALLAYSVGRVTAMTRRSLVAALLLLADPLFAQSPNPKELFQEAVAAQQQGNDAKAIRLYQQLVKLHPEAVIARANLGVVLAQEKRYDEAIAQYHAVLEADPRNISIRVNLALAYQEKGDYARAATELELVHKSTPENAQARLLLANCDFQLQRYPEVVRLLQPLEKSMPGDLDVAWLLGSALIQTGKPGAGLERIDKVAEKSQNPEAFLLAAKTRFALSQFDLARRDIDSAKRLNPSLPGLKTLDGMLLEQTGDYASAESTLREALQQDPRDFDAHFYLGAILYFKRDLKEAQAHLVEALKLRPTSVRARYELALVFRADGNVAQAVTDLEIVTRANPDWMQPHVELSALYFQLHRPEAGEKEKQIVDRLAANHSGPAADPKP